MAQVKRQALEQLRQLRIITDEMDYAWLGTDRHREFGLRGQTALARAFGDHSALLREWRDVSWVPSSANTTDAQKQQAFDQARRQARLILDAALADIENFESTTSARKAAKPFVLVLMPFSPEFHDVYQLGIKPACRTAGVTVERVDEQIFAESILTRIYMQIARADIIVAEMTGNNPNVFYEVGYAHAQHKTLVLLTRNAGAIPFDLKHYPHIIYGDRITDLRDQLKTHVRGLLKDRELSSENTATTSPVPPEGVYLADGDPNYRLELRYLKAGVLEISNPAWQGVGVVNGHEYHGTYLYSSNAHAVNVRNTWGVHRAIYNPATQEFAVKLFQLGRGVAEPESGRWVRAKG